MGRFGVIVLLLSALSGADAVAATPLTAVTIQLNWLPEPEFGGIYEAERSGLFAREGLAVTILKGGPDVPAVPMTAAGRVDFGIAAADEVITLRDKGADVVALFATYQTSPQAIMVRREHGVADISALLRSGGTLIAQPGLAYLKWLAKRYGLGTTKVVPYGPGALSQFLAVGNSLVAMQCFIFAEPLAARRRGIDPRVLLIADTGFDPYAGVVITSGASLRARPGLADKLIRALRAGWSAYLAAPSATNQLMARLNPAMDLETFAAAAAAQRPLLESAETRAAGLGAMSRERWALLVRQLYELGVIEHPSAASEYFVEAGAAR